MNGGENSPTDLLGLRGMARSPETSDAHFLRAKLAGILEPWWGLWAAALFFQFLSLLAAGLEAVSQGDREVMALLFPKLLASGHS